MFNKEKQTLHHIILQNSIGVLKLNQTIKAEL